MEFDTKRGFIYSREAFCPFNPLFFAFNHRFIFKLIYINFIKEKFFHIVPFVLMIFFLNHFHLSIYYECCDNC